MCFELYRDVWQLWGQFSWAATADETKAKSSVFLTFCNSQRDINF